MGDPRTFKAKFQRPGHPWQAKRIEEERIIINEYGLKTKRELWKFTTRLKGFADQAKRLTALRTEQAQKEKKQLLARLSRIGILSTGAVLDDVLALNVKNLLDRRLQTLVYKKGLARTPTQARQYIVHGHIIVNNKKTTAPSYIVPISEEPQLAFVSNSTLANTEHPERTIKSKPKPARVPTPRDQRGQRGPRRGPMRGPPRGAAKPADKKPAEKPAAKKPEAKS